MTFKVSQLPIFLIVVLVFSVAAHAQSHEVKGFSARLGDKVINLPVPTGFEEVNQKFEYMKTRFEATEAPANEVLAGYLPVSDCELLRRGEAPLLTYYAKISVLRVAKETDISPEIYQQVVDSVRKNATKILDPDGPEMKELTRRVEKKLTEVNSAETKFDFSKPQNLGTFDVRENVFGMVMLITLDAEIAGKKKTTPMLSGTSILRTKERMLFVYTYRKYESKADLEILKELAKQWNDSILAANKSN